MIIPAPRQPTGQRNGALSTSSAQADIGDLDRLDEPAFDATTFSKNGQRLLDRDVADRFFAEVVAQAKLRRYLSSEHFSVDGTLLEAWASHKSFKPKDSPPDDPPPEQGRNSEADFHGEERSNATHESTTDPESRLYRKSMAAPAKLCFMSHLLMVSAITRSRVLRSREVALCDHGSSRWAG